MHPTIRPARSDETMTLQRALGLGFGFDAQEEYVATFAATAELDRSRCAFDEGEMVGTLGCYSLDLAVPGARVAAAGTTWITVRTSHRRRGLLRALLAAHFEEAHERGEPIAALWASESSIYGRFGYGCASELQRVEIDRVHATFDAPLEASGRVHQLASEQAGKRLPLIYDAIWQERPGHFARSEAWWASRHLEDPPFLRHGASALRFAVYQEGGRDLGYAQFRVKPEERADGLPGGALQVVEIQAATPAARSALWRFLLDVDLLDRLVAPNLPLDEPLPHWLSDRRRARRSVRDGLWIRVLDVARALESRRYATTGRLVLEVRDALLPDQSGTYALEADAEGARCRRCDARPDVVLDARELGAVYLGGVSLRALARAGRLAGSAEGLARADALLRWDPLPWCPEVF